MKEFLLWVAIAVFVIVGTTEILNECSTKICKMITKMDAMDDGREELKNHLDTFAFAYNLPIEHQALREVVVHLGNAAQNHPNASIHSRLVRYQEKLKNESSVVNSPSTYHSEMKLKDKLSVIESLMRKLNISDEKIKEQLENELTTLNEKFELNRNATEDFEDEINFVKLEMCSPEFDPHEMMSDCWDHLAAGRNETGVYTIYPHGIEKQVLCDMDSNGGGWTVFLLRQKQLEVRENFMTRKWEEYKNGFGTPPLEYWMGNEALHLMTFGKNYSVRLDAKTRGRRTRQKVAWAEWNIFKVSSEEEAYRLSLHDYNPNSSLVDEVGFGYNNGATFSTIDKPGDSNNCAKDLGGFWHYGNNSFTSYKKHCTMFFPTHKRMKFFFWTMDEPSEYFLPMARPTNNYAYDLTFKIRPT